MCTKRILGALVLGCLLQQSEVTGLWSCVSDTQCGSLAGGVCRDGDCVCPSGQQAVLGGSVCVDAAPYYTSPCVEDHQCSRLAVAFECRRSNVTDETGRCFCQPNHHFFRGRCFPSIDYGSPCTTSEECISTIRDPFSMTCSGTCQCAEGYYERQRGECRRIGHAVGDGCVLDADCQFEGGACDVSDASNFVCYNVNEPTSQASPIAAKNVTNRSSSTSRQHWAACDGNNPCADPFVCSNFGVCTCPVGYYADGDGNTCYAELGSPSTEEQCVGLLAVVIEGVCTCRPNFFFEENMRDCVKVSRSITDSCVSDASCHTFGAAAICGEAQPPWGLRVCACDEEHAVWDSDLEMCRLFAGIGESCVVDSDCLAGDMEIQCVVDAAGQGICACLEGYTEVDGLCLTTGLELGDACQVTQECTGTPNTVCEDSRCACDATSYQEIDGACAPIIGGVCEQDSDCVIENTLCTNSTSGFTCQCQEQYVPYGDACWTMVSGINSTCSVSAQCQHALGLDSYCSADRCLCNPGFHHRDGACWPMTGLFEPCSRSSQCYLSEESVRTVCRNSICQCEFQFPYSEELNTCTSPASKVVASILLIAVRFALTHVIL